MVHKPKELVNVFTKEEPILDFNGKHYHICFEPHRPPINAHNKMHMMNFSKNVKYFLFHDRLEEGLYIYEFKRYTN
jgi:hypothetical protein